MRRIVCVAAALALAATGAARADDQADLKKVIDKAIKATGGEEKLAKFHANTFKEKGKFYGMSEEGTPFTGEFAVQHPDKMRVKIEADAGGNSFTFIQVVDGDKVWRKINDDVMEVTDKDEVAEIKEQTYVGNVARLLPLVKDNGYTLAALGEAKVGGKPAVGVRVSHKGHRDVSLYFDKDTGLLAKVESVVKDMMAGGKEVTQEELFSNYKDVGGLKHPMTVLINRDGKKYVDGEISDFELKEKLDDSVFAKP